MAREFAVEDALGSWADRIVAGDREGARRQARIATTLGQALLGGWWGPDGRRRRRLPWRHLWPASPYVRTRLSSPGRIRRFGKPCAPSAARRPRRRELLFAAAEKGFHQARSPAELWAAAGRARVLAYDARYDDAVQDLPVRPGGGGSRIARIARRLVPLGAGLDREPTGRLCRGDA